jgi:NAD dependent epimerase/dehydratase family enzyme
MSWIHIDDLTRLLIQLTDSPLRGAVNGTAPNPVTNAEFASALAHVLGRPALLPAPAFALKAALGDMSGVLLGGQRVLPRAAQSAGFDFAYPELSPALESLLHQ